jgi:hypothetical protein
MYGYSKKIQKYTLQAIGNQWGLQLLADCIMMTMAATKPDGTPRTLPDI